MGMLNSTSDGHCELVFSIVKLIIKEPMEISKIKLLLNPEKAHLLTNDKIAGSITCWKKLGLFEDHGNKIHITQYARKVLEELEKSNCQNKISYMLRRILFSSSKNKTETIWTDESANDFFRALSWMLIQNPFTFSDFSYNACDRFYKEQQSIKDESKEIIQGGVRMRAFLPYARSLGFFSGTTTGSTTKDFNFIDPTNAIQEDLDLMIKPEEEITVEVFLKKLSNELPVFDGGKYRVQVEQILDKKFIVPPENKTLSSSLSLALKRLEQLGIIKLVSRGDASSSYNLSFGLEVSKAQQYSHIKRAND